MRIIIIEVLRQTQKVKKLLEIEGRKSEKSVANAHKIERKAFLRMAMGDGGGYT